MDDTAPLGVFLQCLVKAAANLKKLQAPNTQITVDGRRGRGSARSSKAKTRGTFGLSKDRIYFT